MPIYEFLCPDCNTIFKFFSRSINTESTPGCPKCKKDILEKQISLFATTSGKSEDSGGDDPMENFPVDETKMAHAMEKLMGEAEGMNEEDPRQAAKLMQRLSDMTGLKYNDTIQEALSRMEAGEDPDTIEAQMSDAFDDENPFVMPGKKGGKGTLPLRYDDTLYEM